MTQRELVITGFTVLLVLGLAITLFAYRYPDRLAGPRETIAYLTRTRAARVSAVLVWALLGWHFLAR